MLGYIYDIANQPAYHRWRQHQFLSCCPQTGTGALQNRAVCWERVEQMQTAADQLRAAGEVKKSSPLQRLFDLSNLCSLPGKHPSAATWQGRWKSTCSWKMINHHVHKDERHTITLVTRRFVAIGRLTWRYSHIYRCQSSLFSPYQRAYFMPFVSVWKS